MTPKRLPCYVAARAAVAAAALLISLSTAELGRGVEGSVIAVKVKITEESAPGSTVTFKLLRTEPDCCRDCQPDECSRRCCEPTSTQVRSIRVSAGGEEVKFESLTPGTYLLVNDAGFSKFFNVRGANEQIRVKNTLEISINTP
jgi:hypothetical protein